MMEKNKTIREAILCEFDIVSSDDGEYQLEGKWYHSKWGCDTLAYIIDNISTLYNDTKEYDDPSQTAASALSEACAAIKRFHDLSPSQGSYLQIIGETKEIFEDELSKSKQMENTKVIDEILKRNKAENVIDEILEAMDISTEWSSAYGFDDAVLEVKELIDDLRSSAVTSDYNDILNERDDWKLTAKMLTSELNDLENIFKEIIKLMPLTRRKWLYHLIVDETMRRESEVK